MDAGVQTNRRIEFLITPQDLFLNGCTSHSALARLNQNSRRLKDFSFLCRPLKMPNLETKLQVISTQPGRKSENVRPKSSVPLIFTFYYLSYIHPIGSRRFREHALQKPFPPLSLLKISATSASRPSMASPPRSGNSSFSFLFFELPALAEDGGRA